MNKYKAWVLHLQVFFKKVVLLKDEKITGSVKNCLNAGISDDAILRSVRKEWGDTSLQEHFFRNPMSIVFPKLKKAPETTPEHCYPSITKKTLNT